MDLSPREESLELIFASCTTPLEKYQKIISLGRKLPPFPKGKEVESCLVSGCQSRVYLFATEKEGLLSFSAKSDALISAGLAFLLLHLYNEQSPECVLMCKPTILEKIGIQSSLSPSRSNGLSNMYLHMQKSALSCISSGKSIV